MVDNPPIFLSLNPMHLTTNGLTPNILKALLIDLSSEGKVILTKNSVIISFADICILAYYFSEVGVFVLCFLSALFVCCLY